jgi:hypothetical protein
MKRIHEYLFRHGASHWVRVRIPKDLKGAYPAVLDNLHTGDAAQAKTRSYAVIARIRAEFAAKRGERTLSHASLSRKRIASLTAQHLRIKRFYGTSENAVKTQVWIAVSVYVLVAIIKKELGLDASLHTLLQILSATLFEKISLQQTLAELQDDSQRLVSPNQVYLFDS